MAGNKNVAESIERTDCYLKSANFQIPDSWFLLAFSKDNL